MTRTCEVCDAPIDVNAGTSLSCGTVYASEGPYMDLDFCNPRWGLIVIETIDPRQYLQAAAIESLKKVWLELESNSFQKLAPTQAEEFHSTKPRIEVWGPYSSYLRLSEAITGEATIQFIDKTHSEIDAKFARLSAKRLKD